jgi:hypothetical protein
MQCAQIAMDKQGRTLKCWRSRYFICVLQEEQEKS